MATNNWCRGCCGKDAVMDLVFGELAEQYRIPWCDKCIAPDTWNGEPFYHAEGYTIKVPKVDTEHLVPTFKVDENYNLQGEHAPVTKGAKAEELYSRQPHYEGGIDPITYGKDNFTPEEMNGFYKMNVVKYVSRCDRKNGLEDLLKARDYLNLVIESYEKEQGKHEPVGDEDVIPVGKYSGRKSPLVRTKLETEDVHAERPFKDVIYDLLHNGTLTLKRQSINYWGDAIESYLEKHKHDYTTTENSEFITYHVGRA